MAENFFGKLAVRRLIEFTWLLDSFLIPSFPAFQLPSFPASRGILDPITHEAVARPGSEILSKGDSRFTAHQTHGLQRLNLDK